MSTLAIPEIHEHSIPTGAIVLTPSLCGNCARRLYARQDNRVLCTNCSSIVERGAQIWACLECGTERAWGDGRPAETSAKQLNCARCHEVTEHEFFEVSPGARKHCG